MADRPRIINDRAQQAEVKQELKKAANNAQEVLVQADSMFPLVLFPDTITVDRVKVTITKRKFFQVAEVVSTQIEDVLNVESDTGPFFGSINLYTRFFADQPLRINYLTRRKAIDVKNILQGYIIAQHQGINCSAIETRELRKFLLRLGSENAQSS